MSDLQFYHAHDFSRRTLQRLAVMATKQAATAKFVQYHET